MSKTLRETALYLERVPTPFAFRACSFTFCFIGNCKLYLRKNLSISIAPTKKRKSAGIKTLDQHYKPKQITQQELQKGEPYEPLVWPKIQQNHLRSDEHERKKPELKKIKP